MRQSYRIIPIYTADVSGVCSALYELGGMTVMHDPSGCNSTYNTHDEIRWYDQDSLIYISGLTEIDAIMGNDEKFLDDIKEAAREMHPKFIALAGSPIPYMNGTDFPALAQVLEEETGILAFAVPTNGMHDYVYGAGIALEEIAKRFTGEKTGRIQARTVNLLGVTPLDFGPVSHVEVLKENLKACGWKVLSTWAMGDELDAFLQAGEAEVNLVVSSVGLRAAKVLEEKFGTPYVVGTPIGSYTERIAKALEEKHTHTLMEQGMPEKTARAKASKMANEDARFVLPNACETKMVMTMNCRSLNNFFNLRCCNRAQWEIRAVADEMLRLVYPLAPHVFAAAGPRCLAGPCPEGGMCCGKQNAVRDKYATLKQEAENHG